mgnify:CR=1 FL=1
MTDGMQDLNDKENVFPGFSVKIPLIIGKTEEKECLKSCGNTALFIYMFISLSVISI